MDLSIKIFADTADVEKIRRHANDPRVGGFTTNPTLFRAAGATDYLGHARAVLDAAAGKPVSLEVIADEQAEMARQARELAALGRQVFVKIPITNTRGESSCLLIKDLLREGISINITAVFTHTQVEETANHIRAYSLIPTIVSVFAGRIYDAGMSAALFMEEYRRIIDACCPHVQLLWASPRQVYDAVLADRAGADIITMTPELIAKLPVLGKDLSEFSLDTVKMFHRDAQAAEFKL